MIDTKRLTPEEEQRLRESWKNGSEWGEAKTIRRLLVTLDAKRRQREAADQQRDEAKRREAAAVELLRRWIARGFPMGGSDLWDDTKAFIDLATEPSEDPREVGPECPASASPAAAGPSDRAETVRAWYDALREKTARRDAEHHDVPYTGFESVRLVLVNFAARDELIALLRPPPPDGDALDVLAALVGALPKCNQCGEPATKAWRRGEGRWCDQHAAIGCPDYPRADPLRKARSLLRARGK